MTLTEPATRPEGSDRSGSGEFRVRILSALVLAGLALAGTWLGGWPAAFVAGAVAVAVMIEWHRMTVPGARNVVTIGLACLVALSVAAVGFGTIWAWLVILLASAVVSLAVERRGWTGAGILYAGLFAGCLLAIRQDPVLGLAAVIYVLATVWVTDSGAYLVGRRIGGAKLWPRISPKKTWSGLIGGLVSGVLAGLVVTLIWQIPLTVPLLLVTIGLSCASHAGDLFESAVKRHFGAKDASHLIPGHGGMMDRIDGLIFASVAAALIGLVHGGEGQLGQGLLLW